jgi:hypothetical protein
MARGTRPLPVLHLGLALLFGTASAWLEVRKGCGANGTHGCGDHGNCSPEGKCECHFGWSGDLCGEAVLGACRYSDRWAAGVRGSRMPHRWCKVVGARFRP